jgi:hypothetical protein
VARDADCRHRWFFWPLAIFPNGVVGRMACQQCGECKPRGWRVMVGGRMVRLADGEKVGRGGDAQPGPRREER